MLSLSKDDGDLPTTSSTMTLRLLTAEEAIHHIRGLAANGPVDVKQYLLSIAGIAVAALMALDEDAAEMHEIDGLEELVNCALFTSSLQ